MNENNLLKEIVFLTDKDWSAIDDEVCKVNNFNPISSFENGRISSRGLSEPYASITIECRKINKKIKGLITHKIDFMHLWLAFIDRGIKDNEEVIICWSKKHYKLKPLMLIAGFLPKLCVMVCYKGAFELMTDPNYKSYLDGEARFLAEKPIVEWKPGIMK